MEDAFTLSIYTTLSFLIFSLVKDPVKLSEKEVFESSIFNLSDVSSLRVIFF